MAKTPEETRQATAIQSIVLTVLLDRAGGMIEVTAAEFAAAVERHGGKGQATIWNEVLRGPGDLERMRCTLISKKPKQGELTM